MTVKFITVKGADRLARSPFYVGLVQHERTLAPLPDQHITPGTYENVAFKHIVTRDGATETLTLTIPHLTVT